MANYVKCKYCGRMFQKQSTYYKDGDKYVCNSCAIKYNSKARTSKRQKNMDIAGMQQTYSEMIIKIIIAVLIVGMQIKAHADGPAMVGAAIVAVLVLLWAIIPVLRRNNRKG